MGRRKKLGAGYRQRSDGRYEYRWTDGTGKRRSVCAATLAECEAKAKEAQSAAFGGLKPGRVTFDELCDQFLVEKGKKVKVSTLDTYTHLIEHSRELIGGMDIKKMTPLTIAQLQTALADDCSNTHLPKIMAITRDALDYATRMQLIAANPALYVDTQRPPVDLSVQPPAETIHRALTDAELKVFFAATDGSIYRYLFEFLLVTGLRVGEAAALTEADIDRAAGVIRVTKTVINNGRTLQIGTSTKTGRGRAIGITADIERVLAAQANMVRDYFGSTTPLRLFPAADGGITTGYKVDSCIRFYAKKTKLKHFASHAFRHTYATRAVQCGMEPYELQKHLGHANINMTMSLYYHHTDESEAAAAAKVRFGTY